MELVSSQMNASKCLNTILSSFYYSNNKSIYNSSSKLLLLTAVNFRIRKHFLTVIFKKLIFALSLYAKSLRANFNSGKILFYENVIVPLYYSVILYSVQRTLIYSNFSFTRKELFGAKALLSHFFFRA